MHIVILGGTGFVGGYLKKFFTQQSHSVEVYGRDAFASVDKLSTIISGCDVLIMLAGANIGKRWNNAYKQELFDSRIKTNQLLQHAMQQCNDKPKKILAASAIGIYPQASCQNLVDESCRAVGDNFLGELGAAWEKASRAVDKDVVVLRFGVVLGKGGGALQKMLPPFRLGLGGPVAGGQQCFSWVHIQDLARAIEFIIASNTGQSLYNITAPEPITNHEFGKTLAHALHRPYLLPLPEWQLKLMFGEGAQVLTHSSAVYPKHLLNEGFEFLMPTCEQAIAKVI